MYSPSLFHYSWFSFFSQSRGCIIAPPGNGWGIPVNTARQVKAKPSSHRLLPSRHRWLGMLMEEILGVSDLVWVLSRWDKERPPRKVDVL